MHTCMTSHSAAWSAGWNSSFWERMFSADLVEVRFTIFIRQTFTWVNQPGHQANELRTSPQEAFVIVRFVILNND